MRTGETLEETEEGVEVMGKYDKFWEMREGGPYEEGEQAFKCTRCGAVSYHPEGWDGEPNCDACSPQCRDGIGDWAPGKINDRYRQNFTRIFPDSPGADL